MNTNKSIKYFVEFEGFLKMTLNIKEANIKTCILFKKGQKKAK